MTTNPDFKVTPLFDAEYLRSSTTNIVTMEYQWGLTRGLLIGVTSSDLD